MTKEEAIDVIKEHHAHWVHLYDNNICDEKEGRRTLEAFAMAVLALQRSSLTEIYLEE